MLGVCQERAGIGVAEIFEGHRRRDPDGLTERLLEAAAEAFIEQGYDKAAVTDIARRASATTGAIYSRWRDKNEMMVAALEHIFEQMTPEEKMKDLGVSGQSATSILTVWGTNLLKADKTQDVLVQVFGSARNNTAVLSSLQKFLNEQGDQLSALVERSKDEGLFDQALSTAALVLLIQSAGIGVHLLLSAERADRHIPTEEDWVELLSRMVAAVNPESQ